MENYPTKANLSNALMKLVHTCLKERLEMAAARCSPSSSSAAVTEFIRTKIDTATTKPIGSHFKCIVSFSPFQNVSCFLLLSAWSHCEQSVQMRASMFKGILSFTFTVNMTHSAFSPDLAWVIPGYSYQLTEGCLFVLWQSDETYLIAYCCLQQYLLLPVSASNGFVRRINSCGFQGGVQRGCWTNGSTRIWKEISWATLLRNLVHQENSMEYEGML